MRCPFCAHDDSQVKDSRPTEDGTAIRRRRQCTSCGARFTTFERVQLREVTIIKSGDRREAFDRSKLEQSVALACRKRGIEQERIDQLISGIQRQVETAGDSEVPSARIGELVMDGLRQIDSVGQRFVNGGVFQHLVRAGCCRPRAGIGPPVARGHEPHFGQPEIKHCPRGLADVLPKLGADEDDDGSFETRLRCAR